jgi:hypothetical protein
MRALLVGIEKAEQLVGVEVGENRQEPGGPGDHEPLLVPHEAAAAAEDAGAHAHVALLLVESRHADLAQHVTPYLGELHVERDLHPVARGVHRDPVVQPRSRLRPEDRVCLPLLLRVDHELALANDHDVGHLGIRDGNLRDRVDRRQRKGPPNGQVDSAHRLILLRGTGERPPRHRDQATGREHSPANTSPVGQSVSPRS